MSWEKVTRMIDKTKAAAYRIILGGCLLCWAVVGAIIVVFTLK